MKIKRKRRKIKIRKKNFIVIMCMFASLWAMAALILKAMDVIDIYQCIAMLFAILCVYIIVEAVSVFNYSIKNDKKKRG